MARPQSDREANRSYDWEGDAEDSPPRQQSGLRGRVSQIQGTRERKRDRQPGPKNRPPPLYTPSKTNYGGGDQGGYYGQGRDYQDRRDTRTEPRRAQGQEYLYQPGSANHERYEDFQADLENINLDIKPFVDAQARRISEINKISSQLNYRDEKETIEYLRKRNTALETKLQLKDRALKELSQIKRGTETIEVDKTKQALEDYQQNSQKKSQPGDNQVQNPNQDPMLRRSLEDLREQLDSSGKQLFDQRNRNLQLEADYAQLQKEFRQKTNGHLDQISSLEQDRSQLKEQIRQIAEGNTDASNGNQNQQQHQQQLQQQEGNNQELREKLRITNNELENFKESSVPRKDYMVLKQKVDKMARLLVVHKTENEKLAVKNQARKDILKLVRSKSRSPSPFSNLVDQSSSSLTQPHNPQKEEETKKLREENNQLKKHAQELQGRLATANSSGPGAARQHEVERAQWEQRLQGQAQEIQRLQQEVRARDAAIQQLRLQKQPDYTNTNQTAAETRTDGPPTDQPESTQSINNLKIEKKMLLEKVGLLSEQNAKKDEALAKVKVLKEGMDRTREENMALKREIENLKGQILFKENQGEKEEQQLRKLRAEKNQFQMELEASNSQIKILQNHLQKQQQKTQNINNQPNLKQAPQNTNSPSQMQQLGDNNNIKLKISRATIKIYQSKYRELLQGMRLYTRQVLKNSVKLKQSEEKNKKKIKELEITRGQLMKKMEQLNYLHGENEKLMEQNNRSDSGSQKQNEASGGLSKEKSQDILDQNKQLQDQMDRVASETQSLKTQISKLEAENERLNTQNEQLKKSVDQDPEKGQQQKQNGVEDLQRENQELKKKLEEAKSRAEKLENSDSSESLKSTISELQKENERLSTLLKAAQEENTQLKNAPSGSSQPNSDMVPLENHTRLKKAYAKLKKDHNALLDRYEEISQCQKLFKFNTNTQTKKPRKVVESMSQPPSHAFRLQIDPRLESRPLPQPPGPSPKISGNDLFAKRYEHFRNEFSAKRGRHGGPQLLSESKQSREGDSRVLQELSLVQRNLRSAENRPLPQPSKVFGSEGDNIVKENYVPYIGVRNGQQQLIKGQRLLKSPQTSSNSYYYQQQQLQGVQNSSSKQSQHDNGNQPYSDLCSSLFSSNKNNEGEDPSSVERSPSKTDLRRLAGVTIPSNLKIRKEQLPAFLNIQNVLDLLSTSNSKMQNLRRQLRSQKEETKKYKKMSASLKDAYLQSENSRKTVQSELIGSEQQNHRLRNEIQQIKSMLKGAVSLEEASALKHKISDLKRENERLDSCVTVSETDIAVLRQIIEEMQNERENQEISDYSFENTRKQALSGRSSNRDVIGIDVSAEMSPIEDNGDMTDDTFKYSQDKENSAISGKDSINLAGGATGGGFYQSFGNGPVINGSVSGGHSGETVLGDEDGGESQRHSFNQSGSMVEEVFERGSVYFKGGYELFVDKV